MRIILTLILMTLALTACQADIGPTEISQMVGQVISECPDLTRDICKQIPLDAENNNQVGEVEIVKDSTTATLQWQWEWGERRRETYEITVSLEDESLQPMQAVLIEQVRREEIIEEIEPEQIIQLEQTLPVSVAYVAQFGEAGERIIIKEIKGVNAKSKTEEVVQSTITKDATNWVIVKGTLTDRQVKGDVTRLVRDYFANYQAGNLDGLSTLAPDAAKYNYQAEFYLTDSYVKLPANLKILADGREPKREEIEGSPITEPFSLQAGVPVKVSYTLFVI